MKTILLLIGLVVTGSIVGAQHARDIFADVPKDHWAYEAVEKLRDERVIVGYPDNYFRGKRTLTRYEFAVAIDRALKAIQTRSWTDDRLKPEVAALVHRLATEFYDGLTALGRPIWTDENANAVLLGAMLGTNRSVVPPNHWAYKAMQNLHSVGLTPDDADNTFDARTPRSRLEFAARLVAAFRKLPPATSVGYAIEMHKLGVVEYSPTAVEDIRHLASEFKSDLAVFGFTAGGVGRQAEELVLVYNYQARLSRPFKDVPPNHWAYHALGNLRRQGILQGYPDNSHGEPLEEQIERIYRR